jgi:hypothetical protein
LLAEAAQKAARQTKNLLDKIVEGSRINYSIQIFKSKIFSFTPLARSSRVNIDGLAAQIGLKVAKKPGSFINLSPNFNQFSLQFLYTLF